MRQSKDHHDPDYQDHFESRKERRLERKHASSTDRSKYKKTDQDKLKKRALEQTKQVQSSEELHRGLVISIMADEIRVMEGDKLVICRLKGILKKEKTLFKNLVIVGDYVYFEPISDTEGAIASIEPRKSILSRADNLSRKKEQPIAANVDQVIITLSVLDPPLKPFLIDRYLIAARKGNLEPIIVINKIDLIEDTEDDLQKEVEAIVLEDCKAAYQSLGIPFITLSAHSPEHLDQLRSFMKDKISVFSGQSGVGKSSLINAMTGLDLKVGKTVEKTNKGSHTTTFAQLLSLPFGGWCVDTPGIKSFGVWELKKEEVKEYFDEIMEASRDCRFSDCCHINEEGCAIPKALEDGTVTPLRYQSYLNLLDSIDEKHVKR